MIQVLSFSVSKCLNHVVGPAASETANFALMFDQFFDALNVCNFNSGKHERKPFKDPYRSASDFRLKVSQPSNCNTSDVELIDLHIIIIIVVRRGISQLS